MLSISIKPTQAIDTDYIVLTTDGRLIIRKGYAWDGPSGPALDTRNFMRASLVHDALYQLMRNGYLSAVNHRKSADQLLQQLCREDGMGVLRVWWVYLGLRFGGAPLADPAGRKPVIRAPRRCD